MEAQLAAMSKTQLIEVHRAVFGRVGDSARTSKEQYIAAITAAAEPEKIKAAIAAALTTDEPAVVEQPQQTEQQPRRPHVKPDAAAQQLLDIVRGLAGAAMNEDAVRAIVAAELAKQPQPEAQVQRIVVTPQAETKIEEHTHPVFAEVLQAVGAGLNVLLVGPAGCGKSHLAAQVARALKRDYGTLHCTAGASEAQLTGWLLPVGDGNKFEYVASQFVRLFEQGNSLFLLDEIDAADPNMLLVINAALANGHLNVPVRYQKPSVEKGKGAAIMAAANTYGHGAGVIYAGRNQLDAATLDRFYVVPMDYDRTLEKKLADAEVLNWAWMLRDKCNNLKLRRVVSTRTIQKASAMLTTGADWQTVKGRLLAGWTRDELTKVGE